MSPRTRILPDTSHPHRHVHFRKTHAGPQEKVSSRTKTEAEIPVSVCLSSCSSPDPPQLRGPAAPGDGRAGRTSEGVRPARTRAAGVDRRERGGGGGGGPGPARQQTGQRSESWERFQRAKTQTVQAASSPLRSQDAASVSALFFPQTLC